MPERGARGRKKQIFMKIFSVAASELTFPPESPSTLNGYKQS